MLTRTATQPTSRSTHFRGMTPGASVPTGSSAIDLIGAVMPYARNCEIYGEGEPADYLYKVMSGTVCTYKVLADGRRQIGAFYMSGDLFGLETGPEHAFAAEAISEVKVLVIKRSAIDAMAARDCVLAQELWAATGRELHRVHERLMLLIKSAQERVAGFLLEMGERSGRADMVELPMSRQDIGDYLGLTIETVSRTFTQLENATLIAVPTARRIVIRNRSALQRLNS